MESWTYEKIYTVYGEVNRYLIDYRDFTADDDSNGSSCLIRALEEGGRTDRLSTAGDWQRREIRHLRRHWPGRPSVSPMMAMVFMEGFSLRCASVMLLLRRISLKLSGRVCPFCRRRLCFQYIFNNFGYDKYPGVCHIIPNIAVMILALLYGKGDFSDTINICTMCGWDTDCNVGNVAAIMGVRGGLNVIDSRKWRQPVHDFLACSSVIGSLNIMDIPYGASYIARQAYKLAGEEVPMPWKQIFEERMDSCHFEYPGSTHAIRMKVCNMDDGSFSQREGTLLNTIETAFSGSRSLKCVIKPVARGEKVMVYKKTYCRPADFHDSRYDPAFSPLIYPGQTLHAAVRVTGEEYGVKACLYVHGDNGSRYYYGSWKEITPGCWEALSWTIPGLDGELLDEAGVCFLTGTAEEISAVIWTICIGMVRRPMGLILLRREWKYGPGCIGKSASLPG